MFKEDINMNLTIFRFSITNIVSEKKIFYTLYVKFLIKTLNIEWLYSLNIYLKIDPFNF